MTNRVVFFILGILIISIAVGGFFYFQVDQDRKAAISKYQALAEKERQRARAAEEARREQEQRKLAEIEERKTLQLKREVEAQQRKEEEEREIRQRRQKEEREKRRIAEAEKRRIAEEEKKESIRLKNQREQKARRERAARERAAKTINFNFSIDPKNSKEIAVAQIYDGDEVTINVQRQGANQKIFVGVLPTQIFQQLRSTSGRRRQNMVMRYFGKGPQGAATLVTMPISDHDSFSISNQLNSYHPNGRYLSITNRKDGGILFIGTGLSKGSFITDIMGSRKGSFQVSIRIYSNNRWGLRARKLL